MGVNNLLALTCTDIQEACFHGAPYRTPPESTGLRTARDIFLESCMPFIEHDTRHTVSLEDRTSYVWPTAFAYSKGVCDCLIPLVAVLGCDGTK